MSFFEVFVSQRQVTQYKLPVPHRKTVETAWVEWALEAETIIRNAIDDRVYLRGVSNPIQVIRSKNRINRLYSNLRRLNDPKKGLKAGGWIYTGYDTGAIIFKPIRVADLAEEVLWKHAPKWLLMSATTISFAAMADALGVSP